MNVQVHTLQFLESEVRLQHQQGTLPLYVQKGYVFPELPVQTGDTLFRPPLQFGVLLVIFPQLDAESPVLDLEPHIQVVQQRPHQMSYDGPVDVLWAADSSKVQPVEWHPRKRAYATILDLQWHPLWMFHECVQHQIVLLRIVHIYVERAM